MRGQALVRNGALRKDNWKDKWKGGSNVRGKIVGKEPGKEGRKGGLREDSWWVEEEE